MANLRESVDVVVVGGGLSGLAVAAYLGRARHEVLLLEKGTTFGGRAASTRVDGFALNRGPHALYRKSEGLAVLRELRVATPGGSAPSGGHALARGRLERLPTSAMALVSTGLFGLRAKASIGKWMQRLPDLDTSTADGTTVTGWLAAQGLTGDAAAFMNALGRLTSYVNAPDVASAGSMLRQVQRALGGVLYVDGGWQTLADGLRARAEAEGARLLPGKRAERLTRTAQGAFEVTLADGAVIEASRVVLATEPAHARALVESAGARAPRALGSSPKAHVATLDLALTHVPRPDQRFVLGVDAPLYLSVHSGVAKVAPGTGGMIHVAKYLPPGDSDPERDRAELEALLDLAQPGWRDAVVHAQYLPRMAAVERIDLAEEGGIEGRPDVACAELPGLFFAGDWVKGGSFLADAALGSARAAATAVAFGLEARRSVA